MNMTIVIISKRSIELTLVVVLCGLATLMVVGNSVESAATTNDESNDSAKTLDALRDESQELDEHKLDLIAKDLGEEISRTMSNEMEKLLSDMPVERQIKKGRFRQQPQDRPTFDEAKLKAENDAATRDIRTKLELLADNKGNLPQMSLGGAASSLLEAASSRLATASTFIDSRMRSLSATVAKRIPAKLKRLFHWPNFLIFKARFNKKYSSKREELYHNIVFIKNMIVTKMQNLRFLKRVESFILGQTQYSDMTNQEYLDQVSNKAGEENFDELNDHANRERFVEGMRNLAKSKKNIYGKRIVEQTEEPTSDNKHARSKRNVDKEDDDDTDVEMLDANDDQNGDKNKNKELKDGASVKKDTDTPMDEYNYEDDEDEDDLFATEDDNEDDETFLRNLKLEAHDVMIEDDEANEDEAHRLLEEYSADANLDSLNQITADVNQVLEPTVFDPIDLRDTGCIPMIENQELCGCCFAYVAATVASYHHCMAQEGKERPMRFSARFISDCGRYIEPIGQKTEWFSGCNGGLVTMALMFIDMVGAAGFYPYYIAMYNVGLLAPLEPAPKVETSIDPAESPTKPVVVKPRDDCAFPRPQNVTRQEDWPLPLHRVDFFKDVKIRKLNTLEEVNLHLSTIGPVIVSIEVFEDFKQFEAGVYDKIEKSEKVDLHSMLIVGHSRDLQGREIYIVWNSHGTNWGEKGYLKITAEALDHYGYLYAGTIPEAIYD